jgi:hypothetical protein
MMDLTPIHANSHEEVKTMQTTEKVVYADFLHMKERPNVCLGKPRIPLGAPHNSPDLLRLHEGDQVLLVEPGSFHAQGWIHIVEQNGSAWYYGVLEEEPQEDDGDHIYTFFA